MTVKELIKKLSLADPDIKVAIASSNIGYGCLLREVNHGNAYTSEKLFPEEGIFIDLDHTNLKDVMAPDGDLDDGMDYNNPEPVVWLFGENT